MDFASATPMLSDVREVMEKYWSHDFYNPSAIYEEGVEIKKEVEEYRRRFAQLLGVAPECIFFTSGGTEANTWVMRGVKNDKVYIEKDSHPSVIDAAKDLPKTINLENATIISSAVADNKLGRRVRELRKMHNSRYPLLHIDASQTAQYFNIGLETLLCDFLTLDSAKLYGPKGIGILVVRKGVKLDLPPLGTPPVPLIAGFCKAFEIAVRDREVERERLSSLSDQFVKSIKDSVPEIEIVKTEPNIINISLLGILPEFLVLALDRAGVLVSAGPACNSNKPEPPDTPVRFSFGRQTTENDVKKAIEIFCRVAKSVVK